MYNQWRNLIWRSQNKMTTTIGMTGAACWGFILFCVSFCFVVRTSELWTTNVLLLHIQHRNRFSVKHFTNLFVRTHGPKFGMEIVIFWINTETSLKNQRDTQSQGQFSSLHILIRYPYTVTKLLFHRTLSGDGPWIILKTGTIKDGSSKISTMGRGGRKSYYRFKNLFVILPEGLQMCWREWNGNGNG